MAPTLSLGIYSFFKGNKPKSQSFKKKSLFSQEAIFAGVYHILVLLKWMNPKVKICQFKLATC